MIYSYEAGPVATNAFLVIENGSALIIDAPYDSAEPMIETMENHNVRLDVLLLTHTHWDHTADVAVLKARYPSMQVYVHSEDEYRLLHPMEHTLWKLPFTIEPVQPDKYFVHGDTLPFAGRNFHVLHTPGHTEGSVCFYDTENALLFAGDTLFNGSVGRTDLPGGSWKQLMASIKEHLLPLPDNVQVLCGHGPATTIGEERRHNPYLAELI